MPSSPVDEIRTILGKMGRSKAVGILLADYAVSHKAVINGVVCWDLV